LGFFFFYVLNEPIHTVCSHFNPLVLQFGNLLVASYALNTLEFAIAGGPSFCDSFLLTSFFFVLLFLLSFIEVFGCPAPTRGLPCTPFMLLSGGLSPTSRVIFNFLRLRPLHGPFPFLKLISSYFFLPSKFLSSEVNELASCHFPRFSFFFLGFLLGAPGWLGCAPPRLSSPFISVRTLLVLYYTRVGFFTLLATTPLNRFFLPVFGLLLSFSVFRFLPRAGWNPDGSRALVPTLRLSVQCCLRYLVPHGPSPCLVFICSAKASFCGCSH